MKTIRILILEDDIRTLSVLTDRISKFEERLRNSNIALTILSESEQVKEYINKTEMNFDVILLDRFCKSNGSFHELDFEKFGVKKIISISSVARYNQEAQERGVQKIVKKDHGQIEIFADKVLEEIENVIESKNI